MLLQPNFPALLTAAASTLLIGFVWYHPKVFGTAWMKASGVSPEGKRPNMLLMLGLTFILSLIAAFVLNSIVIHHYGVFSVLQGEPGFMTEDPNSKAYIYFKDFMTEYGDRFRTFKHGAFHGVLTGLMLAMPIIGVNALYERKSFKYVAINTGYWTLAFAVMGGIICAWR